LSRLSGEGIDAVRVEVLARDLAVSKGSFYWHFRDRAALLDATLATWERGEVTWLDTEGHGLDTATIWARLLARTADPKRVRTEVAVLAWARKDKKAASRVAVIEAKRIGLVESMLRNIGFAPPAAESWAEVVSLVCLGWQDRATRDGPFPLERRRMGDILSEVILAATAPTSTSTE
jgi:AcrR family transcriptional regulator